jgi:hypothetical protein
MGLGKQKEREKFNRRWKQMNVDGDSSRKPSHRFLGNPGKMPLPTELGNGF